MTVRDKWSGLEISELVGKTPQNVFEVDRDRLVFEMSDGSRFEFYHDQDCCESVAIEDICGNLTDLIGVPLLIAEEVSSVNEPPKREPDYDHTPDSYTWTFYKFCTIKGDVTVRWYGTSNGYYSESVDFRQTA